MLSLLTGAVRAPAAAAQVADSRHGYVPGLRLLPRFRDMPDALFNETVRDAATGEVLPEGFIPSRYNASRGGGLGGRGPPGVVWHALGVLYDQVRWLQGTGRCRLGERIQITLLLAPAARWSATCASAAGSCAATTPRISSTPSTSRASRCGRAAERGWWEGARHSPCPGPPQDISKPSEYASEHALMEKLWGSNGCVRHYYLLWYAALTRAGLRLPAPHWEGPPVPGHNLSHDLAVGACQNCQGR